MMRVAAAICIALAALCLAAQGVAWLRHGQWPAVMIGHALDAIGISRPRTSWIGVDRLIGYAARIPLALALVGAGVVVLSVDAWRWDRRKIASSVNT